MGAEVLTFGRPCCRHPGFQLGVTGFYAFQLGDDRVNGVRVPPDRRQTEVLLLGAILAHDLPEYAMSMKIKAVTTAWAANAVRSQTLVFGFIKKFD